MLFKKMKQALLIGVVSTMVLGATTLSASAASYRFSFNEFMQEDVKIENVTEEDMNTLELIYTTAKDEYENGSRKAAEKNMKEFYELAAKYDETYENYGKHTNNSNHSSYNQVKRSPLAANFEAYMIEDVKKKDITENDFNKLETLYNEATQYYEIKETQNMKETMEIFWQIANKYEDLYKSTYIPTNNSTTSHTPVIQQDFKSFVEFMKDDIKIDGINEVDLNKLKDIYLESVELKKDGKWKQSREIMKAFNDMINSYQ